MATTERARLSVAPWVIDAVVAAAVTAMCVLGSLHIDAEAPTDRDVDALAVFASTLAGVVLIGRSRGPWPVFGVSLAAATVFTARSYPGGPIYLATAIALYGVAAASSRRIGYLTAGVTGALLFVVSVAARGEAALNDLLFFGWPAVAVLGADAVRGRRERVIAATERRRHLEEQQAEEQRRLLAEERLRIARDLHDSVAHSIATINVQSGVAAHLLGREPGPAGAALEAIRVASRDVLEELGTMLAVLRDGDAAPRHPTVDLDRIDDLVASSRLAGLEVDLRREGSLADVRPAVGAAAYRITQEALTNVIRHAGVDRATVTLRRNPAGALELDVCDDGAGGAGDPGPGGPVESVGAANGSGVGLVGIRERAELSGGRSEIGPRPGGGFRVHVSWADPA